MRVMMKMAAVSAVTALLLCCSAFAATDAQNGCDIVAAVGSDVTVKLNYELKDSLRLQWMHGTDKIFDRFDHGKMLTGNKDDIDNEGSLRLTKVDETKAGTYSAEVHDGGKSRHTQRTKLCLMDAVPQPTVKVECLKSSTVKFTCGVKQAEGVKYNWIHNNELMEKAEGATLTLTESDKKWKDLQTDTFSCNVSNSVSTKSSAAVKQTCFKPKPLLPEKLWGINTWIIIGIGGGVVVLLIIIVIICCCQNRRKKRLRLKDEEELRLGWTNPNQQQHHHHQHNHPPDQHHRHHHQQQPAGHTGPRQHRTKQHRSQPQQQQPQQPPPQRPRAPDVPNGHPQPSPRRPAQAPRPAGNTDDEQPPPLPQPRKKAPKTPRE